MRNDLAYYELKELEIKKLIAESKPSKEHKAELKRAMGYARWCIDMLRGKVLVCLLLLVFVGGCKTVGGLGRDLEWTARQVAEMAERAAENTEVQEK